MITLEQVRHEVIHIAPQDGRQVTTRAGAHMYRMRWNPARGIVCLFRLFRLGEHDDSSGTVEPDLQAWPQKKIRAWCHDGMTAAMAQRNPQGRVRRDWASMTAAVAQRNPQGRVRRDWAIHQLKGVRGTNLSSLVAGQNR